jgi:hypothetical protein
MMAEDITNQGGIFFILYYNKQNLRSQGIVQPLLLPSRLGPSLSLDLTLGG